MGRELKRVPMTFDWPIDKVWQGYLDRAPCTDCDANGKIAGKWCPRCEGEKTYRVKTDPPTGEGFQMWETTTEGSPQSPVFATLDDLCAWLATNATTFADYKASAEAWREMLDKGRVTTRVGRIIFV